MTTRKKIGILATLGFVLIIFGQNFDLVPRNPLLYPPDENRRLIEGVRMPAGMNSVGGLLSFNAFKKYFLDSSAHYNSSGITLEKFSEKGLARGLENFTNDIYFQNSQMGQTLKSIEKKSQRKLTFLGSNHEDPVTSDGTIHTVEGGSAQPEDTTEVALYTSSQRAYVRVKTAALETTCGYSLLSQTVDLKFQSTYLPFDAVAVDYDPKSEVGQVKMQMNW